MRKVSRDGVRRRPEGPATRPRPRRWQRVVAEYPEVARGYEALRAACSASGPLDERTVALVKLAVSVGASASRTTHVHTKKALAAGVEAEALRQVALVALPTIGLPRALDALAWIEESVAEVERA